MGNPLEWIAAIGGVLATIGAWMGPVRSRWNLRVEQLRNGRDRRENELHRRRFISVWEWQRNQPAGEERVAAARWFGEWTGAARPRRGGLDPGPQTPGLHSGSPDEAYRFYVEFLHAIYEPGQLGPPTPPLEDGLAADERPELPGDSDSTRQ